MAIPDNDNQKSTARERQEESLRLISERMRTWNELARDVTGPLPSAIIAALSSGRPELVRAAPSEPLTAIQAASLYNLIGILMETNDALKMHAEILSSMTSNWADGFKHLNSLGQRIERFAHFRSADDERTIRDSAR